MYMYLDDAGNIDSPEGALYVWAGIAVKSGVPRIEEQLDRIFSEFSSTKGYGEKKGFDANFEERKQVFDCLVQFDTLKIAYVVLDKSLATENQSRFVSGAQSRNKEQSENHFLTKVVQELAAPYDDATRKKIILTIDGQPQRGAESAPRLHEHLSLTINFPEWNTKFSWNHFDIKYESRNNQRMVQAVDFVASFLLEYYKMQHYSKGTSYPNQVVSLMNLYQTLRTKVCRRMYRIPGVGSF